MKTPRGTIFLGDYVRALTLLEATDDATCQNIAELLGLEQLPAPAARAEPKPTPADEPSSLPTAPEAATSTPEFNNPTPTPPEPRQPVWLASTIEPLPPAIVEWSFPADPLPGAAASETVTPPPLLPLFVPNWTRAILSASLATMSGDGPIDVDRLVGVLARGAAIRKLYRFPRPTLRRGVQLLIDRAEGLVPFAADQRWLQDEIIRAVGLGHMEVLRFANCPTRGAGRGPKPTWNTYQPPAPGTVVALATDLGIGLPPLTSTGADAAEWRAFAETLRWRGCPLVAFVPYPPARYPYDLSKLITIIQWDRRTTAATIQRLIRGKREAAR